MNVHVLIAGIDDPVPVKSLEWTREKERLVASPFSQQSSFPRCRFSSKMAFRHLTRNFFQCVKQTHLHSRFFSTIQRTQPLRRCDLIQQHLPIRAFSSVQTNANAYRDLETFLQKEIQLEKSAQQHPSKLPTITGFQVSSFEYPQRCHRLSVRLRKQRRVPKLPSLVKRETIKWLSNSM